MIAARAAAAAACIFLLGWHTAAESKVLTRFSVANWKGGAYTRGNSDTFSHCAASAKYRSGIYVLFSVNRNYRWSVGFGNPNWQLTPRSVYPIAFSIDGARAIGAKAIAITPTTVEVPLQDNAALFERFKYGELLRVAAANQVFSFRLTDTSKLLPVLLQCVRNTLADTRLASGSSNPFTPQGGGGSGNPSGGSNPFAAVSQPPTGDASNTNNRAEATMIVANLMSLSGIQGFRILSPDEAAKIKADAVWRAGDTLGTVRILSPRVTSDVKNLSGLLIGADARKCKGTFASGALPAENNNAMVRVFTSCKTGDKTFTIYYLALDRKQGGYYLFATGSSGSEQPAKEADASIRQAVLGALPK
jgi:hypothetical protein